MFSSSFFRRLFLPYLLVICTATAAVGLFAAARLRESFEARTTVALRAESRMVGRLIAGPLRDGDVERVREEVKALHGEIETRITVVDDKGVVVADNEADPAQMENHADRAEIALARANEEGASVRPSATLHQDLFYFAHKLKLADAGPGRVYFIRLAVHLADLDKNIHALYFGLGAVALLAMVAAGGITYFFARRGSKPVIALTEFANALARGELNRRYLHAETGETAVLAGALNVMADSLSRLIAKTHDDNDRLLTILSSMNEGVIATDAQQHILFTNESASTQFGFSPDVIRGKLLWEVVRSDAILKAAREVLDGAERKTIHVGPLFGRHLEVTTCTVPPGQKPEGLIVVAHDTTQSVQYQELRKEFVANVSHELRTPLSIIKGFAETLREGAIEDPVRGPQYLGTIEKHADQLTNLVSDLLELSRLDSQAGLARRAPVELAALVRRASDLLLPAAQRKKHRLTMSLPGDLPETFGNADYLERAVTNLIDNAIKYTPEEGNIRVTAREDKGFVIIEVCDNGIGIPREEVPRIFERFYRVDRSRSRELGGTGLGLSIVKHVAQVHGGTVEVVSTPGEGSCFRLRLPVAKTLLAVE